MADVKKYYWLKLKRDFFKRHDIQIIENMPNGKDYVLFYLKLLVESVDHDGALRFSDTIPYNEQMLATITNTNIDIVRSAMKVFSELKMMEILDDSTIFITETQKMLGFETTWAEKKRNYRQQKEDIVLALSSPCPLDVRQEIEIELDKEIYTGVVGGADAPPKVKNFIPPTLEEVTAYCTNRNNGVSPPKFVDFYSAKGWMIGKNKMKDWKAAVRTWEMNRNGDASEPEQPPKRTQYKTIIENGKEVAVPVE